METNQNFNPQSQVRLDRGRLPSETLKNGSLERGESAGGKEESAAEVVRPLRRLRQIIILCN
jgi:hypothetical protein